MPNTSHKELTQYLKSALKRLNEGRFGQMDIYLVKQAVSSSRITIASDGCVAVSGDAIGNIFTTLAAEAMKTLFHPIPHEIPQEHFDSWFFLINTSLP